MWKLQDITILFWVLVFGFMYLVSVDPMDLSKINNVWRDQNKKQISWSKIRIRRFKIGCLTWWISYLLTILGIAEADGLALNPDIRIGDSIICPSIQDWQNQKLLWNGLSTQWYFKLNTLHISISSVMEFHSALLRVGMIT